MQGRDVSLWALQMRWEGIGCDENSANERGQGREDEDEDETAELRKFKKGNALF